MVQAGYLQDTTHPKLSRLPQTSCRTQVIKNCPVITKTIHTSKKMLINNVHSKNTKIYDSRVFKKCRTKYYIGDRILALLSCAKVLKYVRHLKCYNVTIGSFNNSVQ